MPKAEIIVIGTELLLGEIVDTNTPAIARQLRELGVDLYRTSTVGDNPERIAAVIREAILRAEIIITTGGLGPTVDDPTRQAVSIATESPITFSDELWQQVEASVSKFGRSAGENQKRQAFIPVGAKGIPNPVGTAPGMIIEKERRVIISLPGVPAEMVTMLNATAIPYLRKRFGLQGVIRIRVLHVSGMGESLIDEKVGDLELCENPTVGLAAHPGCSDIRITAKSSSRHNADLMIAKVESQIRERLGIAVFGADEETLENVTMCSISRANWSLAVVDGSTGRDLLRLLENYPSFVGGREYNNEEMNSLLEATEQTSRDFYSTAALGLTFNVGIEPPEVHLALVTPSGKMERLLSFGGHPDNLPRWAVNMALDQLRRSVIYE